MLREKELVIQHENDKLKLIQKAKDRYTIEIDPGVPCDVWLPPPFAVLVEMPITMNNLWKVFKQNRLDVIMAYPIFDRDDLEFQECQRLRLRGLVRRGLLCVWTDSEFIERAVDWIKKSGFVTVEVLMQPFFDMETPKACPYKSAAKMFLIAEKGHPAPR